MTPPEDAEFRAAVVQTLARARQDSPEGISVVETAGGPLRTSDEKKLRRLSEEPKMILIQ